MRSSVGKKDFQKVVPKQSTLWVFCVCEFELMLSFLWVNHWYDRHHWSEVEIIRDWCSGTVMVWWFTSWAKYGASWSFTNNNPVDGRNPAITSYVEDVFGTWGMWWSETLCVSYYRPVEVGLLPRYLQGSIHPMCSCFIKHFGTDGWAPFSVFVKAKIDMANLWPERGQTQNSSFFFETGDFHTVFAVGLGISFLRSQFWKRPHPSRNSTQPQR